MTITLISPNATVDSTYSILNARHCEVCGEDTLILLSKKEHNNFRIHLPKNTLIQDLFPDWTPELREILISGTHAQCWQDLFGTEIDD